MPSWAPKTQSPLTLADYSYISLSCLCVLWLSSDPAHCSNRLMVYNQSVRGWDRTLAASRRVSPAKAQQEGRLTNRADSEGGEDGATNTHVWQLNEKSSLLKMNSFYPALSLWIYSATYCMIVARVFLWLLPLLFLEDCCCWGCCMSKDAPTYGQVETTTWLWSLCRHLHRGCLQVTGQDGISRGATCRLNLNRVWTLILSYLQRHRNTSCSQAERCSGHLWLVEAEVNLFSSQYIRVFSRTQWFLN